MFGMALTIASLTMQLTSGMDVFTHVCGQKADTSSNHCDIIQPYDETFQFLSSTIQFLECFFSKLPQIRSSNFRKVVQQHTECEVLYDKVRPIAMSLVYYFSGTPYIMSVIQQ